jgi:ATP-binding cassette subfamily G (WHITE) protein 2
VNIASLPEWLRWLQYLSVFRYGLNMLSINELTGQTYYTRTDNGTVIYTISGETYLKQQGIAYETTWDQWQNIMALGLIAVGLMTISYIQLRRMKKLK